MVYSLVYVSTAISVLVDADIINIVETARRVNARKNITGMLLYDRAVFMQLLEGDEGEVNALYEIIKQDKRHVGVTRLWTGEQEGRTFEGWHMGYRKMSESQLVGMVGLTDYLDRPENLEEFGKDPSAGEKLMSTFKIAANSI